MNKITKIFNNIGFYCSVDNDIIMPNKAISGYAHLDNSSIGYFIPYLIRNVRDNYKWEIGVGEIQYNEGSIVVKRYEVVNSSNHNKKVAFSNNENEFYLFVNSTNFDRSFNNVIVKNNHFTIDNISTIYLVDNTLNNIDCSLPKPDQSRNLVVDIKPLSSEHSVIIRTHDGVIFESTNTGARLVSDGISWYNLNKEDKLSSTLSAQNENFYSQSNPGGNAYSFQYNDGANGLLGSEVYWSSGNTNKLLLGSSSESLAHTVIPASGSGTVYFNKDYLSSDFIVYGSGQSRNLFFSYDGRLGLNIPSGSRPQTIMHLVNYSCSEILRLENRTSCQPAKLTIYHKPSSLSNGNISSILNLAGRDVNNNQKDYANIYSIASDVTNGYGGLVLSVSSGNSQQSLMSGNLTNLKLGYDNRNISINNSNGAINITGSSFDIRSANTATVGTSNTYITFTDSNRNIQLNYNSLSLGTGSIISNGNLAVNSLSSNEISLPNIAASSLLALSADKSIVPISGISINNSGNGLIINNISGNRFLTTDSNNNVVGTYSLDDYFLTEKDITWNKYNPRPCSVCLKQITFTEDVPSAEFIIGDQIEINTGSAIIYRTITDIIQNNNAISEIILNQNVTTNTVDSITIVSITRGGYLLMQKDVVDVVSDSTSNILSIRPDVATQFNTGQKNIDFVVYGTDPIPGLKVHAYAGSRNQNSGIYYDYATASNIIASIPINISGNGLSTNFSSANFNYNTTNNLFSGILSSVGSNGLPSYYGTYDQNGNVAEWVLSEEIEANSPEKYAAGGSYQTELSANLKSVELGAMISGYENIGFRVASINNIIDNTNISNTLDFNFHLVANTNNPSDTGTLYLRSASTYEAIEILNLGSVDHIYRINEYETTNNQYTIFLNAVATGNNLISSGLYDVRMSTEDTGGIIRSSNGSAFVYATKPGMDNKPVVFVSYINALQYINWLHNGAPITPAELEDLTIDEIINDGAYSLLREDSNYIINYNDNQKYFLPNIHEWHKAAYFKSESVVFVSGKPLVTINTNDPHIVATEDISINTATTPRQILADLTVSGWLVVDKIIVRDGTIRSRLTDIGFTPTIPADDAGSQTVISPIIPPERDLPGGSASNTYWNNPSALPRIDGVYGEISPPLPPDGNGDGPDISCTDADLIAENNLPYWCSPGSRFKGPSFY